MLTRTLARIIESSDKASRLSGDSVGGRERGCAVLAILKVLRDGAVTSDEVQHTTVAHRGELN